MDAANILHPRPLNVPFLRCSMENKVGLGRPIAQSRSGTAIRRTTKNIRAVMLDRTPVVCVAYRWKLQPVSRGSIWLDGGRASKGACSATTAFR